MRRVHQILANALALLCVGNLLQAAEYSKHWAFQPVKRPAVPEVKDASWPAGDIDRFILLRLEAKGLKPAPRADRRQLMRRLSFTLTGLPPSPEDLDKHLKAKGDSLLTKYVDALMASPEFGEHWARHWLDHVRYRPFKGKGLANDPYRLWVVRAFNVDMPYNLFLKMQIAGDLMPGANSKAEVDLDGLVAVRPFSLKNRHTQLLDLLGRTFMGLSLFCARCHDHKHERLSREDYFALQGIFESSRVMELPYLKDKKQFDEYTKGLAEKEANEKKLKAAPLKEYGRVAQLMDLRRRLADERKKLDDPKEAKNREKLQKNIDKFEKDETKRLAEIKKRKLKLDAPEVKEYLRLQDAIRAFDQKWKKVSLFEAFVDQADPKLIADARPPKEGVKVKPGKDVPKDAPVPRRFPVVLAGTQQQPLGNRTKQSGRLELAEWLADAQNPITARLMVNRIWYYLLGEGLSPSLSNFGHSGQPPTHPALLDYLSDEFVQQGWSMKRLIRAIVLSATYQQTSTLTASRDEQDLRLGLFGVARVKRLEVESIWRTLNLLEHDPQSGERRREPPYDMVREMEDLFDGADRDLIVPRRSASISSLQALFFMNSEHVKWSTEKLAARLHRLPDDPARIRQVFRLLYGREASKADVARGEAFLKEWKIDASSLQKSRNKNAPPPEVLARWQAYLQALLATNEFMFIH